MQDSSGLPTQVEDIIGDNDHFSEQQQPPSPSSSTVSGSNSSRLLPTAAAADPMSDLAISISTGLNLKKACIDTVWHQKKAPNDTRMRFLSELPFSVKKDVDIEIMPQVYRCFASRRVGSDNDEELASKIFWDYRCRVSMDLFERDSHGWAKFVYSGLPQFEASSAQMHAYHKTLARLIKTSVRLRPDQLTFMRDCFSEYVAAVTKVIAPLIDTARGAVQDEDYAESALAPSAMKHHPVQIMETLSGLNVARAYAKLVTKVNPMLDWDQFIQLAFASYPWFPDLRIVISIACNMCVCDICREFATGGN